MGGRHDSYINVDIAVTTQRPDFSLLQYAQQFNLQRRGHIANLIKKQRPTFSGLKQPFAITHRTGKGTARMTKQFGLEQLFRQRTAVNGNKGFVATRAGVVNGLGKHFFPGAALAVDQYAYIRLRHHPRLFQQPQHQRTAGDDRLTPAVICCGRRLFQRPVDRVVQRVFIDGLCEKAEHPLLRCRNGIRDGAVGGEDNYRHSRLHFLDFSKQLHAVHFIHAQIANNQIHFFTVQHP